MGVLRKPVPIYENLLDSCGMLYSCSPFWDFQILGTFTLGVTSHYSGTTLSVSLQLYLELYP